MAIATGLMTVSTTAAAVDTSSANPYILILHNESGSNTINLGNSSVTAANGFSLHASSTLTLPMAAGDQLYAITSSGSHDLSWMKIS